MSVLAEMFAVEKLTYRTGQRIIVAPSVLLDERFRRRKGRGKGQQRLDHRAQEALFARIRAGAVVPDLDLIRLGMFVSASIPAAEEVADACAATISQNHFGVGCHLRQLSADDFLYELWRD